MHSLFSSLASLSKIGRLASHSFSKSALVGVAATFADLFLLFVLVDLLYVEPRWANLPALLLGVGIQFLGNKHFAFQSSPLSLDSAKGPWKEGFLFSLVEIVALILNATLFHIGAVLYTLPYLPTRLATGLFVYIFFSYPLWKRIFEEEEAYPVG